MPFQNNNLKKFQTNSMKKSITITEDHLDLIHYICQDGTVSQREIAKKTGLSIGKVNYCLKALIDIGFIKIQNLKFQ